MKAAMLSRDAAQILRVYQQERIGLIAQRTELIDGIFTDISDPALRDAEAIFSTWGMPVCTAEEIRTHLPNLKYLFYAAGSVQTFARPFLERGVRVFSAWQANAVPVAEYTYAQILLALKGYFAVQAQCRTDRQAAKQLFANYPGVFEARIGLLGCGAIGSRVAQMLKAQDVDVWAYDPFLTKERARQLGVRISAMEEIFARCDVVSNHLANLPETEGIIRREHLLAMKPYATFINTGRGPQLCEKDLYDMLVQDLTRCALIDVMTDEENSDANPLNALPNCLITPHIAGSAGNEVHRMADYMLWALKCIERGAPCEHEVTMKMLDTMA